MNFWKTKSNLILLPPKHKLPMKRANNINYNYFNKIDTEYKAYILGFIYADGCVMETSVNRENTLRVSIQIEDSYILEKLLKDTNNNKITVRNPPSTIKNGWKKQGTASISSNQIFEDLTKLGCLPNKTKDGLYFPFIEKNYIHHFIRGFFDGDGCITIKKDIYSGKKVKTVNFSKRVAFTSTDNKFLDILLEHLPITKIYKRVKKRTLLVYTYWIERQKDIENLKEYLYKDATYFLKRKKDKFDMSIKSQAIDTSIEGLTTT